MGSRFLVAFLLLATIGAGLVVRYGLSGFWAKYGGVALWATAAYATICLVAPALRPGKAMLVGLLVSSCVELAQLTPVPAYLSSKHLLLRLVFGTSFSVRDLPAYGVGIALAGAVHCLLRRRAAGP
jgi:hypothetical protein